MDENWSQGGAHRDITILEKSFWTLLRKEGPNNTYFSPGSPIPLPFTILIPSIYSKPKTNHASVTAFFPALLALCLFFI